MATEMEAYDWVGKLALAGVTVNAEQDRNKTTWGVRKPGGVLWTSTYEMPNELRAVINGGQA